MPKQKSKNNIIFSKISATKKFISANPVIKNTFYILVIFALLSWTGLLKIGPLMLSEERYITVTGTFINVEPNQIATFNATINEVNKEKNIVIENLNKKTTNLIEAIKSFGIDPINIKTINNSLYQSEEISPLAGTRNPNLTEKVWRGSNSIEIRLEDIQKVQELTTLLSGQENTELFGPNYTIDESKLDEGRLLANALDDAKEKAGFIAKNNNKRLGKIISIEEVSFNNPYMGNVLGMGSGEGAYMPGSSRISKTVMVKFELY